MIVVEWLRRDGLDCFWRGSTVSFLRLTPPLPPPDETKGDTRIGGEEGHARRGREIKERYSFRDFVLLRVVLAREAAAEDDGGGGGPGFASGWKLSALMHLRR